MTWLRQLLENEKEADPKQFLEALKVDLFEDEVFVFTPKGEVKNLSAGSTPLDFAYSIHTDVGHRCVGAKVNGKIVPLHYQLRSGDIVEVLTAKQGRGPSRDWLKLVRTSRARNKIRAWFQRESREDAERRGREQLMDALQEAGLPQHKVAGSPLFADVIREMGFRKADDFYIALGQSKISTKVVANKVMQRLKRGEAVEEEPAEGLLKGADDSRQRHRGGRPASGSRSRAWTTSRCGSPSAAGPSRATRSSATSRSAAGSPSTARTAATSTALKKAPERFTDVSWDGDNEASYRVELQVDAWDRTRLLEDLSRTFAEAGLNILEAPLHDQAPDGEEPLRGRGRRHRAAEAVRSRGCATSTRSSTPTGSRRPPEALPGLACSATAARIAFATFAISASDSYLVRGQKKPRRPSFGFRGTTWTWRWGTLWLTTLLRATKEPGLPIASGIARESSRALANSGASSSSGRSAERLVVLARDQQRVAVEQRPVVEEGERDARPRRRSSRRLVAGGDLAEDAVVGAGGGTGGRLAGAITALKLRDASPAARSVALGSADGQEQRDAKVARISLALADAQPSALGCDPLAAGGAPRRRHGPMSRRRARYSGDDQRRSESRRTTPDDRRSR